MTWTKWVGMAAAAAFLSVGAPASALARGGDDLVPQLPQRPRPETPETPGLARHGGDDLVPQLPQRPRPETPETPGLA